MKRSHWIFVAIAAALIATPVIGADKYEADPAHTSIGFAISHMVISKVKGSFREFQSELDYDPDTKIVTRSAATIKTASIDTGIAKRDEHLRSADFFDAEKHPEIKFESKYIENKGGQLVANGALTIHGVTHDIALPFKVNGPIKDPWGKTRLGIEAKITVDRKDYGLTWNNLLETGGLVVGDEVEIEIHGEFVKVESK